MDVIEVRGRLYDLITRDDNVGGEGTNGRVVSPAQKAKSGERRGSKDKQRETVSLRRWAYDDSGPIGSLSHPRVGTRKTRLFKSSSRLSYAATMVPRNLYLSTDDAADSDTHRHHLHLMYCRVRFQGTDPFESRAK
jgi:hypothetical protein